MEQPQPPKVSKPRIRSPNGETLLDRVLGNIGLERKGGGSA